MLSNRPTFIARPQCPQTEPHENRSAIRRGTVRGAALIALILSGCTAAQYKKSADKEIYGFIESGEKSALGRTTGFNIDTPYSSRKPEDIKPGEIISERAAPGKMFLTIEQALALGVANNRDFQSNKERLFDRARELSNERHQFSPRFAGSVDATLARNTDQSQTGRLTSGLGATQALTTGGKLTAALANDILHYYVGSGARSKVSTMSLLFTQPLLSGAGSAIVREQLNQSERNLIYEIRSFDHFQQTFAVQVVVAYLRLLQQKDTVRNQHASYQASVISRDRMEALSDRQPRVQIDQARQKELNDRNNYLSAVRNYRDASDNFKQLLCLPLTVELQFDDKAIEELKAQGLPQLNAAEEAAFKVALEKRLDLVNFIDRFEDSKRKINVAASALKPSLLLVSGVSLESDRPTDYTKVTWDNYKAFAGLQLDLPLDRLEQRNTYRKSFITFEVALRDLARSLDDLRDDLRSGLRQIELTRNSYEIQRVSVELADQRVESAELLLQAGRIQVRDLLDAQNDQLRARNAFTAALIDHFVDPRSLHRDQGKFDGHKKRVQEHKQWNG